MKNNNQIPDRERSPEAPFPSGMTEIDSLLSDLYAVDPSLREKEPILRNLLEKMLKAEPNITVDPVFVARLREKLLASATPSEAEPFLFSWKNIFRRPLPALSSVVIVVLLVVAFFQLNGNFLTRDRSLFDNKQRIIPATENSAFGGLTELFGQRLSQSLPQSLEVVGIGGKGGGGDSGGEFETPMQSLIAPDPINYRFSYAGEPLPLDKNTVTVYKHRSPIMDVGNVTDILSSFDLGFINLDAFKNLKLSYLTFAEDRDFGYVINIDFTSNTVFIYENWEKWGYASSPEPINFSQIPADSTLIAVSNAFLTEHSVDISSYGEPEVQRFWEKYPQPEEPFAPELIDIVYPLLIEGVKVVDDNGNPVGLRASVNIRFMRVANVNNLRFEGLESSSYAAETDPAIIIGAAEKGGMYFFPIEEQAKEVVLPLGTPETVYLNMWHYPQDGVGAPEEFFVPALKFPVTKRADESYFYLEAIVIPLAKELLTNYVNPPVYDGGPVIM